MSDLLEKLSILLYTNPHLVASMPDEEVRKELQELSFDIDLLKERSESNTDFTNTNQNYLDCFEYLSERDDPC